MSPENETGQANILINEQEITGADKNHAVTLKIIKAPPAQIHPGAYMPVKIQGYCVLGCNIKASVVQLEDSNNNMIKEVKLVLENGIAWESDTFIMRAPSEPGEHIWTARFAKQLPPFGKNTVLHGEALAICKFEVLKQHITGMAAWDIPSPVVVGSEFSIKVGVRCSNSCSLAGNEITVVNSDEEKISNAILYEAPLQNSESMYWAQLELQAPNEPGRYGWRAAFCDESAEAPHLGSRCAVDFTVVPEPESTINVNVISREDNEPIAGLKILVPPYNALTDENGLAQLNIANGKYKLTVSGAGKYNSYTEDIRVVNDIVIHVELDKCPPVFED